MKKLLLILMLLPFVSYAQDFEPQKTEDIVKEATNSTDDDQDASTQTQAAPTAENWLEKIELDLSLKNRYKLYQTENIYTFLELDTKTGQIKQVQWSLDSDNEGSIIINGEDLTYGYGYGSGSFELYPTKNMYQFILLDKTNGRKWHIQWGMEDKKRWIRRIL